MRAREEKAKMWAFFGNKRRNNQQKAHIETMMSHWNTERWTHSAYFGSERRVEPVVRPVSQSPDALLIGQQRRQAELSQGPMQMRLRRVFPSFLLSNSGMFADIDEGQSNQGEGRVAVAAIDIVAVRDRVLTFCAAAVSIELFEAFGIPGNRRKQPQIGLGFDVEGVPHRFFRRGAVLVKRALVGVKDPFAGPVLARTGTDKDMRGFALEIAVMPHPAVPGTQRGAVGLKGDARVHGDLGTRGDRHVLLRVRRRGGLRRRLRGRGRLRRRGCLRRCRLCVLIPGNDRDDAFRFQIAVDAHRIVMPVADEDADLKRRLQVFQEFQEAIQGFQRQRKIRFVAAGQHGDQGNVVPACPERCRRVDMYADGVGAVAEGPAMPGIIAPLRGGAGIAALAAAFRAGRTVTGALPVTGGVRGFGRAIAGDRDLCGQQYC